jgi:hypothetical protein
MVSTALDRSKQAEDDLTAHPSLTRGGARGELAGPAVALRRCEWAEPYVCFQKLFQHFVKWDENDKVSGKYCNISEKYCNISI